MKKRYYIKLKSMAWSCSFLAIIFACSENLNDGSILPEEDDYATVSATDMSSNVGTRAMGMTFEQFSLTIFNAKGKTITSSNLIYKEGDAWKNSQAWKMATTGNMNAYGISPKDDIVSLLHFADETGYAYDDIYFDYTVPTTEQTMIKIGSNLGFSRKSTGGNLSMNFVNAMATLSFRAKNNLKLKINGSEDKLAVRVNVKGVTIHNINAHGRFTFDKTKSSKGTWTLLNDTYYNYAQNLQNALSVDSVQYTSLLDSAIVVLPQTPDGWSPAGTEDGPETDAISYADAAHKAYVELKCNMMAYINNTWQYVWGNDETFPSVYLPYIKKQATVKYANINTNGMYSIILQEGAVLDQYGHPIKPQTTNGNDSFLNAEFVSFSTSNADGVDMTDDWSAPEETVITF